MNAWASNRHLLAFVLCLIPGLGEKVANGQSLTAGSYARHTLGIRPDGTVSAWGYNFAGQVSGVPALTNVTAVAGGFSHSLALRSDGTVVAWGDNGVGLNISDAASITNATAISAGFNFSLALKSNGTISAWGRDSEVGKVFAAPASSGFIAVSAGRDHALALRSNGTVAAWGLNSSGSVTGAASVTNATAIAAGGWHSLALKSNGTVAAWGENTYGQVAGASSITNATAISAGREHSLALRSNGTVAAWGRDNFSQVSGASTLNNVVYVAAGDYHNYAVLRDGTIASWGSNSDGQRTTPSGFALPTTVTWKSATSADYLTSHQWSGGIPSTALSTAVFDKAGTYAVGFGNSAEAKGLNVTAGNVTFNLNSSQYLVGSSGLQVNSGASLTVNGGTLSTGAISGGGGIINNSTVLLGNSNNWNLDSQISGSGTTIKTGSGTVSVNTGTISTATLRIDAGSLQLGQSNNLIGDSTNVVMNGGELRLSSGVNEKIGSLSGNSNVFLGSGTLETGNNNSSTTYSGVISDQGYHLGSTGSLTKVGTGTMTLSGANTYAGKTQIIGGTLQLGGSERLSDLTAVSISSGASLSLNGYTETIGTLSGSGNVELGNGGNLIVTHQEAVNGIILHTDSTFAGNISGTASSQFTKTSSRTLTMTGQNDLAGTVEVAGGTLRLAGNNTFDNASMIHVSSPGTLDIVGSTQNMTNVTSDGIVTLNSGAVVSADSFSNFGSVAVNGNSTLDATYLQNAGSSLSVSSGSSLTADTLVNEAGSLLTLNSGASLSANSLINNGNIVGDVNLSGGQTLSGTGTIFGMTTVDYGSVIAPGNSIGTMNLTDLTWGPGGIYDWEIANALGTPGSEWDFINLTGSLNITASSLNPFSINLFGFGGPVANFDASQNYSWSLLSASGGIFGFNSSDFLLDSSLFPNPYTGMFSLAQSGNTLNLLYTGNTAAVPEPGSFLLLSLGAIVGAMRYRRRNQA